MVKVLICGGGNGAHVLAGIASSKTTYDVTVLSLYEDEAEKWTSCMESNDFVVEINSSNKSKPDVINSKPKLVTNDPSIVSQGYDVIVFVVPSYAHHVFFTALKPFIKHGTILIGCPGHSGFELEMHAILSGVVKECTIMSLESLPWACRIKSYGQRVEVLATKRTLVGAIKKATESVTSDAVSLFQSIIGDSPKLDINKSLLGITLKAPNICIHPAIMYGFWHKWDGKPLDKAPLFYNGVDKESAHIMSAISDECLAIAKDIMTKHPDVDLTAVEHVYQWYLQTYGNDIGDSTNLYTIVKTNRAYKGLLHPCKQTEDGKFIPDYTYRYMTEDIPYGLVVIKGIALLSDVQTPEIDKVVLWAQKCLGKEYITNEGTLGKDVSSSRAPQCYGILSLEQLLALLK